MRRLAAVLLCTAALALGTAEGRAQEAPEPSRAAEAAPGGTAPAEAAPAGTAPAGSAPAPAQPAGKAAAAEPQSLFELLERVKQGLEVEKAENLRREQEFIRARADQQRLLAEAQAVVAQKEALSQELEQTYNANEKLIGESEALLAERLGELGELFGVVRQVATDTSSQVWDSLVSSQLEPRTDLLDRLGRSKELPTTDDLERLWYELQREMTHQGEVVRYRAPVLTPEGQEEERDVVRAGPFSAVSGGRYLLWEPSMQKLRELTRQPPSRYASTVGPFEEAESGFARLAVDPSRGALLSALLDLPDFRERLDQGGAVGYTCVVLGIIGFLIGTWRWLVVSTTGRRVAAQRKSERADRGNPLGRVLAVYEDNRDVDTETLELRLDEAVMRESGQLQKYLWLVKTVSVVAPLLGLLGTVTGMIQTFQAIVLFGSGDPKVMADGIAEALVTTVEGLVVAIPLTLLYAMASSSVGRIIDVLDEQSAGLIALRSEHLHASG
jgi:biopolymer transport protein ExbB